MTSSFEVFFIHIYFQPKCKYVTAIGLYKLLGNQALRIFYDQK